MTEQLKLVTNAQESKIFKTNATAIKISVSTTFHGGIVSKLTRQAWNKAKISAHIPLKTALSKRENHSRNDALSSKSQFVPTRKHTNLKCGSLQAKRSVYSRKKTPKKLDHKLNWIEMGSWNNSWVKNLPVRPLAPRRKTPGQLYPKKKRSPKVYLKP